MKTGERIMAELTRLGKTRYWLHTRTGIDLPAIYRICADKRDPKASTLDKINAALSDAGAA